MTLHNSRTHRHDVSSLNPEQKTQSLKFKLQIWIRCFIFDDICEYVTWINGFLTCLKFRTEYRYVYHVF